MEDPAQLLRSRFEKEIVLACWRRMEAQRSYRILSNEARVLFPTLALSARIERDFSVSGAMVTAQRTCLSSAKIDMFSFLNRNRDFVNNSQSDQIPRNQLKLYVPNSMTFALRPVDDMEDIDALIEEYYDDDDEDELDEQEREEEETKSDE